MYKKQILRMAIIAPVVIAMIVVTALVYIILHSAVAGEGQYLEQVPEATEMHEEASATGCNFNYLVGQNVNDAYLNLGRPVRVIEPGDAVTQDFNPERVNVIVDTQGYVTEVTCG